MNTELKPYPAYRDSGLSWLGKIPGHWKVLPNRALFSEVKERNHPEEQMLSVTITRGVIRQDSLLEDTSKKDGSNLDRSAYKLVRVGDIVYNKMRAWQGAIGISAFQGIVSPAYVVLRLRQGYQGKFFHYLLRTPQFAKEAERWSYGITSDMWSLRPEHFRMIYSVVPSDEEQSAIVRFVEYADRQIRQYITAKQKLIKLLEEKRRSIVHHTIQRGIDVNVSLKSSGVDGLGDIPEHWEVRRVRNVSAMLVSNVDKHTVDNELPVRLCNYVDVYKNEKITSDIPFMPASATVEEIEQFRIFKGDVIITKDSESWNDIGVPALVESATEDLVCGYHLAILRPKVHKLLGMYLLRALQCPAVQYQFHLRANGVTRFGLSHSAIKSVRIPLPPLPEQEAIAHYLDKATLRLTSAIAAARSEVGLMLKYRERLVADVVTGAIDVREAVRVLPSMPEDQTTESTVANVSDDSALDEDMTVAEELTKDYDN